MGCAPDGTWFGKPSYLGFCRRHILGTWTQIHEEKEWMPAGDRAAHAYQPQIAPKWIAADGSRSVGLDRFQFVGAERPYYSFNTQKVELVTE